MQAAVLTVLLLLPAQVNWQHPMGMVTRETIDEVREKIDNHDWARVVYEQRQDALSAWLETTPDRLRDVFPTTRGNVYHNFSCPDDRTSLTYDPFTPFAFTCPDCGNTYEPGTDAGVYQPDHPYHGTMYDGWACMFYMNTAAAARDLAIIGRIEQDPRYTRRVIDLLIRYADTMRGLEVDRPANDPDNKSMTRLLTYHREGDSRILFDLALAFELVRDQMTEPQRQQIVTHVLERLLNDIMLESYYTADHNNVYRWHQAVLQAAVALEREDLVDWCFGRGAYDAERLPEHRSMERIVSNHFHPDGAFWELCSGYHLYPVYHLCEWAVLSRNLSRMDRQRFPAAVYDYTSPDNPGGKTIHAALQWFVAMAMPDRTMPVIGDSMSPRAGMDDYFITAEIGYRYFDILAVGDYEDYRVGRRRWEGLLYGAPVIDQHELPFASTYLSSGWVSLRNDWKDNRTWIGINALIPGGGHQHADRLSLTSYSHGQLLALEKTTPYNEQVTRKLGERTPGHNTVVVDGQSQPQGERLTEAQTPRVVYVHAGPIAQFAEVHGDGLYEQADVYRRSVALIEDVTVDLFRVKGGRQHDWLIHHAGPAPELSVRTEPATFKPRDWLSNGTDRVRRAALDEDWSARWRVNGVTSRLTMLGGAPTTVCALETYPVDNAVITDAHPPCQTLCVRRTNDAPFLAVWDAWRGAPNLASVTRVGLDAVTLTTREHTYRLRFGVGAARFADGVELDTDAAFCVVRDRDAVTLIDGTRLRLTTPHGDLNIELDEPATLHASFHDGSIETRISGDIQFDTHGGRNHDREPPDVAWTITGDLWQRPGPEVTPSERY